MKLVIEINSVDKSCLTVFNGDSIVCVYEAYGKDLKNTIDKIFKERYIEAVYFNNKNAYAQKFIDYIEENYKGVEIL